MRRGCGGRTLLCVDKDRLVVWSSDQWVGYMQQFLVWYTRHEGGIECFICQREKAGAVLGGCTLQSLDFCAKPLVLAMTCGEVLSNNFFCRIRQLWWISRNFPRCTCSWQLNTSLSTVFAGYKGCDLYLGLSHLLTALKRMSHGENPTLLENDRYQEIEEEDWVKCLHRAHSSSASAGHKLIQYR